jgi:hypothetical protein
MRKAHVGRWGWCCSLVLLITGTNALAQSLTHLQFDIVGIRLAVEPPALTVPKDVPTLVNTHLTLPAGAGTQAQAAVERFADGAAVLAELRGPQLTPTTIAALPGEPLQLPPLHLPGDYFLDNIRLVKDGETILAGMPSAVPIKVISEVLVSKVTTRELSLEEIREQGIVIDESNFRAQEFQVAFVIDGIPVDIDFPVIFPKQPSAQRPGQEQEEFAVAANAALTQQQRTVVELPPELDRPGFNLYLVGAEFVPVSPDLSEETRLQIPPIPALVVIPGNIGFLNQFFSAIVMVQNDAPDGSNLEVRNVTGTIKLPPGRDGVVGTFDTPGDDPLRLARTEAGLQDTVRIVNAGVDGTFGTADDRTFLRPQESGDGEFLIEGLREGTHVFDIELEAELHGLPSGPIELMSVAKGTVQVSNPTFSLTFSHPQTVRTGEPYELFATVTNTSDRAVNLVSVNLDPRAVSGAELLSEATVQFDTIASGQAATARFQLLAQRTGAVTFSQVTTEPGITANFTLHTGIDERGVPLSPRALVLPKEINQLPDALITASQRVLGQAYSVATAPRLPAGVRYISRGIVTQRGRELAEVGMRLVFNEPIARGLHDLLLDWLGNTTSDPGFEQLLRTTEAGQAWTEAVGATLAGTGASPLQVQSDFAETVVYRHPHLSAIVGESAVVRVTNPFGQRIGRANTAAAERTLPFSQLFELDGTGDMAVIGKLNSSVYTVEVFGTETGTTEVGVVFPSGEAELTQVTYENLATAPGSRFVVTVDTRNPGDLALRVDSDGDGEFDASHLPTTTEVLVDQAPQAVAARVPIDAHIYAPYGLLVDVLFTKTVEQASVELVEHYALDNNAIANAVLQPTGRVATLLLQKPIGGLIPRELFVEGIADERGNVSTGQMLPINDLPTDGGTLVGQVRRADGRPVAHAFVQLSEFVNPVGSFLPISNIRTDADGYFDFDFVRKTDTPAFNVTATDPATGDTAAVNNRVRFEAQTVVVNPVFFGRGRVVGRVFLPDGVTPAGPAAVNFFPDFYRTGETGKGVFANQEGAFTIEDVPVGNFKLQVDRVEFRLSADGTLEPVATGEFATITGTVRESGETVEVTVVLTTRPDPARGGVRGRVFLSDGQPAVGFPVFLGGISTVPPPPRISAIARAETDETGSFDVVDVPVGAIQAIAVDPATQQFATADVTVLADQLVGVNVLFGATGVVSGIVRDASGNLVPGALVSGGYEIITADENGRFVIPEVPIGTQTIAGGSEATQRIGTTSVDVFPGQTTEVEIRLQAAADITGRVTDAQGNPVPGALVRIPIPGSGYFKATTDPDGFYVFPNMALGKYTVSASGRNVEAPLSPDEVATKLTNDMAEAINSRSRDAIRAAYKQAVEVFVGTSNLLFQEAPAATPGSFGFTTVQSFQDGIAALANIQYIPTGRVAGVTVDGNALPTKASMEMRGLSLDAFGLPKFGRLGLFESDAVTGAFAVAAVPHGDYQVKAARPFSPVIITHNGVLHAAHPNDDNLVLQFPPAQETNGTFAGVVLLPDGATPAGAGVEVQASFGDLTVTTDAEGRFDSPTPIPAGIYTLTATDPVSTLTGQVRVTVPAGGTIDTPIRLFGRTSVVVMVERPDGSVVANADMTVSNNRFPRDVANGVTDAAGKVRFTNLNEGFYSLSAVEGDSFAGRSAFAIEQEDVLMNREVGATVVVRGFGTISGTFLQPDSITPIVDAQISLFVAGVAVGPRGLHGSALTTTDAEGRFVYDKVPVGDFRILAENPRNLRVGEARGRLVNQGDTVELFVITGALGRIEGQVLTADGLQPIPGATVAIQPSRLPVSSDSLPRITAGVDGSFAFEGIPEGPFTITAFDTTSGFFGSVTAEVRGEGDVTEVEVRIEAFGTIRGQVFEADGHPATAVDVSISSTRRRLTRSTAVDGEGRFEFKNLPIGLYKLRTQKSDPAEQLNGGLAEAELTQHGEEVEVEIDLRGVGMVVVTVVDANGDAVPSADVELIGRTVFGGTFSVFTLADGTATIPGVPVGTYDISVQSSTLRVGGSASGEILAPGETVSTLVELGPAGSIAGRLVLPDANATPVPDAFVTLQFASQTSFGDTLQVLTNALGEFAFANIPVGAFSLDILEPLSGGVRHLMGSIDQNEQVVDLGRVVLDLDAPRVEVTDPAEGATGVPVDQVIALTFNEAIDPASVQFDNSADVTTTAGNLLLINQQGDKLTADVTISGDNRTVFVTPRQPFDSTTRYQMVVRNGTNAIRDAAAGRPVQDPFVLSFTSIDSVPPELVSQTPQAGASGVLPEAVVRLTFSETVAPDLTLSLTHTGQPVAGSVSLLFGNTVAVFTPEQPLMTNATYQYTLTGATDVAGNALVGGDVTASFATLDTQGPTISALNLDGAPSRIAGTSVTVVPTLPDTDLARVDYAVNDVPVQSVQASPFAFTVPLPVGKSQVRVAATGIDTSGNRGQTASLVISIVPNQQPTVTLTNTTGVVTLVQGQPLTFAVEASDDVALSKIVFSVVGVVNDSQEVDVPAGQGQFMTSFDLTIPATAVSNGDLTIQAGAIDSVGNPSQPVSLALQVQDGVKPTATFLTPVQNAQVIPGQSLDVVLSISDDVALESLTLTCNQGVSGCGTRLVTPTVRSSTETFTVQIPGTLVAPATVTLAASVRDTSGNLSPTVGRTLQIADTVAPGLPSLQLLSAATRVFAGQNVTARAQTSDNVAVTAIEFRLEGALTQVQTASVTPPAVSATVDFPFTVPATAPNGSQITVRAQAFDAVGNASGEATLVLQVGDTAPPAVVILIPAEGSEVAPGPDQRLTLTAQASDDVGVRQVSFEASGVQSGAEVRSIDPAVTLVEETFELPVPAQTQPGVITFLVSAEDVVGNVSAVATRSVTVIDNLAPSVQITSPAAGASVDPRQPLDVTVVATDNDRVSDLTLTASGVTSFTEMRSITPAASVTEVFSIPFASPPVSGGSLTLNASARDGRPNTGTAAAITVAILDVVPPEVASMTPAAGTQNVALEANVVVQFSEALNPNTVSATTARLEANGTAIPAALSLSGGNTTLTLTPAGLLPVFTPVTLRLTSAITDAAGVALTEFTGTFTTESADVEGPRVQNIVPADGASEVSVATRIEVTFDEAIDPATVDTTTFAVTAEGTPVSGVLSFLHSNATVRFIPDAELPFGAAVKVQLSEAITDPFGNALTDAAGNPLSGPLVLGFTTATFSIINPQDGVTVPEQTEILLQARGSASLGMTSVIFVVDGVELPAATGPDFTAPFTTPLAVDTLALTIAASARNAANAEVASDAIVITVGPALRMAPRLLGVPVGEAHQLGLFLSSAQTDDVSVSMSAVDTTVVAVPSSPVVLPAGATETVASITGVAAGSTTVIATSELGTASAVVSVSVPEPGQTLHTVAAPVGVVLRPLPSAGRAIIPPGQSATLTLTLLAAPAPGDTPVTVTSSNPAVAEVLDPVTIPAGARTAMFTVTAGTAGTAELILRGGGEGRVLTVIVGVPPAGSLPPIVAAPVGVVLRPLPSAGQAIIPPGQSATLTLTLLAAPAPGDTPVTVTSSNPAVAEVLDPVTIPAGARTAMFTVTAGTAGTAELILRGGGEGRVLTVIVGVPPAGNLPPIVAAPVGVVLRPYGTAGTLFQDTDTVRTITLRLLSQPAPSDVPVTALSADPTVADVQPGLTSIQTGARSVDLTVSAGPNDGETVVLLQVGSGIVTLRVLVGLPPAADTPVTVAPAVCVEVGDADVRCEPSGP